MTNYIVYTFSGIGGFVNGEWREKKIRSFLTYFEDKKIRVADTTKDFFEDRRCVFSTSSKTIADLRREVADGVTIFPINKATTMDTIKNYVNLGLKVKFMRDREFKQFKKEYTLNA